MMPILLPGDVVLVHGHDFVDDAIEFVTHSKYSHVALAVNGNTLIEAQGGRVVGYQPASAYSGQADVFRTQLAPDVLARVVAKAESYRGEHYDDELIVVELVRYATGINLPCEELHKLICSTLVGDAFRGEGYDPCLGIRFPSPADEAKSTLWRHSFSY